MAKDIKAIQCPNCGSVYNKELKPDYYKCENCGTEYFLDSDDKHIYHHHERFPPVQTPAPAVNHKLPAYIILGVIFIIAAVGLITINSQRKYSNTNAVSTYKMPRMFRSSFVYMNTATGEPVYLRMGTDRIDKGNEKADYEWHAQFNNALNGKLIADHIMDDKEHSADDCSLTFKTYSPELIYAVGCSNLLLQLDTRNNKLTDVTQSAFAPYPQLSSGVARLAFHYTKPMITVMSNEGESYYYFPLLKKLVDSEAQAEIVAKEQAAARYFEFGSLDDVFGPDRLSQLIEVKNVRGRQAQRRNLTPARKYFSPAILYQDATNLLIVVNSTAAAEPPVIIQRIDVENGRVLWALAPDRYFLQSVAKCKQGYAIEYRKGAEADYVHGVMVISPAGKLVYNYQLARTE
jgi:hypothetical protein